MAVTPTRPICLTELNGCHFGFYSPVEIRHISVKHITVPASFERNGDVTPSGLYDPALGPIEKRASCETCGLDERGCQGHYGHVELPLPVYNPFFFGFLFRIIKCTCLHCFSFKVARSTVEHYLAKLILLRKGETVKSLAMGSKKNSNKNDDSTSLSRRVVKEATALLKSLSVDELKRNPMSSSRQEFYALTIKEFQAILIRAKRCANCGCINPGWRKEGNSNMIVQPLLEESIVHNKNKKTVPCNAMTGRVLGQSTGPEAMTAIEVMEIAKRLWSHEHQILDIIGGGTGNGIEGYKMYFYEVVLVTPNKYRPCLFRDGRRMTHAQSLMLTKIISISLDIRSLDADKRQGNAEGEISSTDRPFALGHNAMRKWVELQAAVNALIDGIPGRPAKQGQGMRQLLEKKEGIFRRHLMGKRVNFAARSTISPDINLSVDEVGIPPTFATTLSYPERVTDHNCAKMKQLVLRGAKRHPGAVAVEDKKGTIIDLAFLGERRREALARRIQQRTVVQLQSDNRTTHEVNTSAIRTVYRHVQDGDILLTNRQPTLHKSSLMAHRARVLPGERTIRFHYANCAAFNADFDGDEINLHLPQDHLSRAESYGIIHADHQYISPTNGEPLRGLIQDSIDAGVLMSMSDTFLNKMDYMNLLFTSLGQMVPGDRCGWDEYGNAQMMSGEEDIVMQTPAILKPVRLWTGKQTISSVLMNLSKGKCAVTTASKCKTPFEIWGDENDGVAMFRESLFLTGVLDKNQYKSHGIVHVCQELYGDVFAGKFLSSLSRLFVKFLQRKGFTCGISDAFLTKTIEKRRSKKLKTIEATALEASAKMLGMNIDPDVEKKPSVFKKDMKRVVERLSDLYRSDSEAPNLHDSHVKTPMHQLSSDVMKICLPEGIARPFRHNCLTVMTATGAKGSFVNFSQISCLLGQQELEGQRVPRMMSGRTLPCFLPYDAGARSGGFIADRFLTGLRPPEYYFHCMAGREGLVDTSIKTASSGYLQRCLVKSMESLRLQYDFTVRDDSDGTVVQFYYGEDGLDVATTPFLDKLKFMAENAGAYKQKLQVKTARKFSEKEMLRQEEKDVKKLTRRRERFLKKGGTLQELKELPPVMSQYRPSFIGSMSETMIDLLWKYTEHNPDRLLHEVDPNKLDPKDMQHLVKLKYMESLAAPGEAVGILAAQSIGEPSTQMTLNTFHMAGRGEANVTLGIPRLREILMTASATIKTPVMILPMRVGFAQSSARKVAFKLRRIRLAECIKNITVEEYPVAEVPGLQGGYGRKYTIIIQFHPIASYPPEAEITWDELAHAFKYPFAIKLNSALQKESKRIEKIEKETAILKVEDRTETVANGETNCENEPEDENEDETDAKRLHRGGRSEQAYDVPDVEDKEELQLMSEQLGEKDDGDNEANGFNADVAEEEYMSSSEEFMDEDTTTLKEPEADEETATCRVHALCSFHAPRLSLLGIVERTAAMCNLRSRAGIQKCYVVKGRLEEPYCIQTDGVSFETAAEFADVIDINHITSNDIHAVLNAYGVEAARSTIINECKGVFGAYGIVVDPRHLTLIADYMTNLGGYRGCNYYGIRNNPSSLLKMSFERSTQFIQEAVLNGDYDPIRSPAARIVVGRPPLVGTGSIDILPNLPTD